MKLQYELRRLIYGNVAVFLLGVDFKDFYYRCKRKHD